MEPNVSLLPLHPQLISSLIENICNASALQNKEIDAAVKIQSTYRMWKDYQIYITIKKSIISIQRMYRGHMQRKRVKKIQKQNEIQHELFVYNYYASRIQACFRGFYVRCYIDNYYARKKYILQTMQASDEVREISERMLEDQKQEESVTRLTQQNLLYREATEKLHHMVSTASVSGVYRRPDNLTGLTTTYGTNVEDDIRRHALAARRPQHIRKFRENIRSVVKGIQNNNNNNNNNKKVASSMSSVIKNNNNNNNMGDVNSEAKTQFIPFTVRHGAWNRTHVEGITLPSIKNNKSNNSKGESTLRHVITHSCIDNYTPLYDTESAELAKRVDLKEMQILHGNKAFVVPAAKRIPALKEK